MLHIYKDAEEVCDTLAIWIADLINKTLSEKEKFMWALSGGETPKMLYQKLAADYHDKIKWEQVHIFWGDERFVPFDDPANNAKMAYDTLLSKVKIPGTQIHKMRTDILPEASAKEYEEILHQYFKNNTTTFDLTLLGMGDDGHTLSIFPGTDISTSQWVSAIHSKQKGERISLMPSVVNRSASIAFLVTGDKKAKVLHEILNEPEKHNYPAQLIKPANGVLHWFLDEGAAGFLK